jgi:hypothetical protein
VFPAASVAVTEYVASPEKLKGPTVADQVPPLPDIAALPPKSSPGLVQVSLAETTPTLSDTLAVMVLRVGDCSQPTGKTLRGSGVALPTTGASVSPGGVVVVVGGGGGGGGGGCTAFVVVVVVRRVVVVVRRVVVVGRVVVPMVVCVVVTVVSSVVVSRLVRVLVDSGTVFSRASGLPFCGSPLRQ